ncbi:hypothetical protein ACIXNV_23335 [Bacteroides fragilis]
MKKQLFYLTILLLGGLYACSADEEFNNMVETASNEITNGPIGENVSKVTAERNFAKILSVAATKDSSLRTFLKQEAQKQFDKDYDVFYPYVKDKVIEQGKHYVTFLLNILQRKKSVS